MEDHCLNLLKKLEYIFREGSKNPDTPGALHLADYMSEIAKKYQSYFPYFNIIRSIVEMNNDKKINKLLRPKEYFQLHSLSDKEKEIYFLNYIYDSQFKGKKSILIRFFIYGLVRSICEVLNEKLKPEDNSNPNSVIEYYLKMELLLTIYRKNRQIFSSITINSRDQKIQKSIKIPDPSLKFLFEGKEGEIEQFERTLKSSTEEEKEIMHKRMRYVLSLNVHDFERDIFHGIMDDFDIVDGKSGKQNESYKAKLLWKVFIHTHSKHYHETDSSDGRNRDVMNKEFLFSIIKSHSNFRELI